MDSFPAYNDLLQINYAYKIYGDSKPGYKTLIRDCIAPENFSKSNNSKVYKLIRETKIDNKVNLNSLTKTDLGIYKFLHPYYKDSLILTRIELCEGQKIPYGNHEPMDYEDFLEYIIDGRHTYPETKLELLEFVFLDYYKSLTFDSSKQIAKRKLMKIVNSFKFINEKLMINLKHNLSKYLNWD